MSHCQCSPTVRTTYSSSHTPCQSPTAYASHPTTSSPHPLDAFYGLISSQPPLLYPCFPWTLLSTPRLTQEAMGLQESSL